MVRTIWFLAVLLCLSGCRETETSETSTEAGAQESSSRSSPTEEHGPINQFGESIKIDPQIETKVIKTAKETFAKQPGVTADYLDQNSFRIVREDDESWMVEIIPPPGPTGPGSGCTVFVYKNGDPPLFLPGM